MLKKACYWSFKSEKQAQEARLWSTRPLHHAHRLSLLKRILIWLYPSLNTAPRSLWVLFCLYIVLLVISASMAAWTIIWNGYILHLPRPPPMVNVKECAWLSCFYVTKTCQRNTYKDVQRLLYAEGVPEDLREPFKEKLRALCTLYHEEEKRKELMVAEAADLYHKQIDEAYKVVYDLVNKKNAMILRATGQQDSWLQWDPAKIPLDLLQYGGLVPGDFGFGWKKVRYELYKKGLLNYFW